MAVLVLLHRLCVAPELFFVDPTLAEGDFLKTAHFKAGAFLQHFDIG